MRYLKAIKRLKHKPPVSLSDTSGVVAIEASIIFSVLAILCMAMVDYGFWVTRKSALEAVSYSLVSVLRERTYLYAGRENITQQDLDQLTKLAGTMLGDKTFSELCITIERVDFEKKITNKIATYTQLSGGAKSCRLKPAVSLKELTGLSSWSNRNRWVPLYQVTLSVLVPQGTVSRLLQGVGALPERVVVSRVALQR